MKKEEAREIINTHLNGRTLGYRIIFERYPWRVHYDDEKRTITIIGYLELAKYILKTKKRWGLDQPRKESEGVDA